MLFGLEAPKLETARVLELGCSEGGNIIRFALDYPKSYCLGVDLSKVQIDMGCAKLKKLKAQNIELKHLSITDLDESYGKFDYIICHGVFSWVPDEVKEAILEVSNKLLSKNGVSFISYNTLPGWNMINTVREAMLYHSANFQDVNHKIQQSRAALAFLNESLEGQSSPHAKFMKECANEISDKENNYLRHEYLAEENKAFYFHEFVDMANKHSLQYLGDTDIHRMFVGNLPKNAAEKLGAINDIVKTEQYIDFIRNTRFRCTILCHQDVTLSRNITMDTIKKLYLSCYVTPEKDLSEVNINDNTNVTMLLNNNKETKIIITGTAMKAILYTFAANVGNVMSVDEIVEAATKIYDNKEQILSELASSMGRLIFSGYVKVFSDKPKSIYKITDKPKVSQLIVAQASSFKDGDKPWITNQINQMLGIESYQRFIMPLLDGKNTTEQIKELIFEKLKSGEIIASKENKGISDDTQLKAIANEAVDATLMQLKMNFGLIA
jgi:methyltransferase-like protein/2-polyprenyl-3-methyl-5-hydroxy-6-metoxy-1,4-benzoquinol methylase